MFDVDRIRLYAQSILALAVLGGATFLGTQGVIEGESVVALYSVALGAVGAGAVGGSRPSTTTTTTNGTNGHTERVETR